MFTSAIQRALVSSCHNPELLKVMDYAVFPAGKLFRPKLVEALALDLNKMVTQDHYHLGAAIEIHHAYTLVHDDLPSMDNDLLRRGKSSTHAHFGEWKAILAGDALLIASFGELTKIKHPRFREINKLMSWTTGAKGLIEGQFRDLEANGDMDIANVIRIHELKTGRLIQLATLGTYLLSEENTLKGKIEFLRLGRQIGVSFQLLDDLSDLLDKDISDHEKAINPFIRSEESALNELRHSHSKLSELLIKHKLFHTNKMIQEYFKANQENLSKNFSSIEANIAGDPSSLKKWITNFV